MLHKFKQFERKHLLSNSLWHNSMLENYFYLQILNLLSNIYFVYITSQTIYTFIIIFYRQCYLPFEKYFPVSVLIKAQQVERVIVACTYSCIWSLHCIALHYWVWEQHFNYFIFNSTQDKTPLVNFCSFKFHKILSTLQRAPYLCKKQGVGG